MTTINFRLYGEQIYGLSQKYLTEYISPEIVKEDFITQFKSGKLSYENLSTKKQIQINPQISLDELTIQKIDINIPNETENLSIYLDNVKSVIQLSDITDDQIEKMIIDERKELIDKFKDFVIKKIEKKESSKSFIEGLIENFVNRAINGLSLVFNNIEFIMKYKNHIFTFIFEKINYSEDMGIQVENISLVFEEDMYKKNIINRFSINVEINPKENKDIELRKLEEIEEENKEGEEKKEEEEEKKEEEEKIEGEEEKKNVDEKKENIANNVEKNEENKINKINVTMSNFELELNQTAFYAINDILNLITNIPYQKVFLRYKKLIQFHRPKEGGANLENEENDEKVIKHNIYISKWYYAIKTVVKLQKYIGYKKDYIFDLIESSQIKISKKYLENNTTTDNILLPTEINLLKSTKEKVENQLLENKKGGGLTKAFSFFFGGGGDDKKKELTEEEKEELNNIYTDNYIIKYLLGLNENKSSDSNPLNEKINKFISNIILKINVEKIELILININEKENNKCNLFIKDININFNLNNKKYDFEININDIGTLLNDSLFDNRINVINYLIQLKKEPNNELIKLNLGFNNIILNEQIFIFILSYIYSLNIPNQIKLFHEIDYNSKINQNENKEQLENKIVDNGEDNKDTFQLFNNFSVSHIPSLTLLNSNDDKIEFNLINYSLNKDLLSFTINIKDTFGTILDDYTFNLKREQIDNKQKYQIYLEDSLNIISSKKTTFFLFITYLKLKKILDNIIKNSKKEEKNEGNEEKEEKINLFCLNFIEHKDINIDFQNIILDIMINELSLEIIEKKCKTFLSINNLILKYENKELIFKTEKIGLNTDYLSTVILYILDFKSKDFDQYEKLVENNLNISFDNMKNEILPPNIDIKQENLINANNNITTSYNLKISDILTSLTLEINLVAICIKIEGNNVCAEISQIIGKNNSDEPNIISIELNNANLYIEKNNNLEEKFNILNINKPILINYILSTELIKIKIDSPLLNIFKSIFVSIFYDIKFLLDQIDLDVIICKSELELLNVSIQFNIFNFLIGYLYLSNFDGKSTDTQFLKINNLLITNDKNKNILEEKELQFDYTMKSKYEDYIYFKLNTLKLNLSQNDINYINSLSSTSNEKEEQNNTTYKINNMNLISSNSESLVLFEEEKNNNINTDINNNINNNIIDNKDNNKIQKEHTLLVEGGMHNINVELFLNDDIKKSDLSINNIGLNLKNANIKNKDNDKFENLLEYKFIVNRIILKYFDDYNNQIIILNYSQESKNGIKINLNRDNQFEIISEKNLTKININKNEIIIRIDYFLLLYNLFSKLMPNKDSIDENNKNDVINAKESNNENNIDNKINNSNNLHIEVNFNNTKFQLQTSLDAKEYINLLINDFCISYNPLEENNNNTYLDLIDNELYHTNINIKLGDIESSIISEKQSRKLFYTKKEFLFIKCGTNGTNFNIDIYLGTLIINISYQDIICFLKTYILNKILIENIKDLEETKSEAKMRNSIFNSVGTMIENNKSSNIKAKLIFIKLDFTLVDNSYGSYQPFLTGALNKVSLNYNQQNTIECNLNILLSSYNYISCIWEPILENLFIKLNLANKENDNVISIDINEIILNLSDMAISSTLIILQHWIEKFPSDHQRYLRLKLSKNNIIQFNNEINKSTKITNNTIINYTGMDLNIKYHKNEFKCLKESEVELEYINDWDITKYGTKKILVSIINQNISTDNQLNISIEKIGIYEQYFDYYNNYLIAENTLSKNRRVKISIYSPIIIKNKTFDSFQVIFSNENQGNYSVLLKSNGIIGIPFSYHNDDSLFSLNIINNNNLNDTNNNNTQNKISFNLKDFIECNDEKDTFPVIPFGEKVFHMKLIEKLNNLKEILITFQYCIVNCLPCSIIIENIREKKSIKIKKFTQHFIDFYSDLDTELIFKIKIREEFYTSVSTKYFQMNKKNEGGNHYFTVFSNKNKTQSFKLSIQYNKSKNINLLIIYPESILYNDSGIDFNIVSQNEKSTLCYDIGNKFYLISSQIKDIKKAWIQLTNDKFISNRIILDDIIESKPFYKLNLENNEHKLNLILKTSMSYISIRNNPSFKENIMTMIYRIYPICRITNLLKSKNILICENNNKSKFINISSLQQINFNFFEKGKDITLSIGLLNFGENKCSPPVDFKLTKYGIFSFCRQNTLFNIEVKESSIGGIIDIFIVETNLDNAKIIVENLSSFNFNVVQEKYEQFVQSIAPNDKQILKIYEENNNYFIFKSVENNKSYRFKFNFLKEEDKNYLDKIVFIKQSNGIKMKCTILNKNDFYKLNKTISNINLLLKIENIIISIIADNEFKNKKLRNYQRKELLLIKLSAFKIEYNLMHQSGLFEKDKIKLKIFLENFALYNQISKFGKFSCVFKNISTPMSYIETDILNHKKNSMSKINNLEFKMGKLGLNIDPNFIEETINFFENILYRMEIINFNVDEIFLSDDRDAKVTKQFENYQKDNTVCYSTNISFPEVDIKFQLTEVGLGKLLFQKANCSDFFVWLGYGLVGKEQDLYLKKPMINSYLGSYNNLIQKIMLIYNEQLKSEITNIGLKGLWGQIEQFFLSSNKTNKHCTEVQNNRYRIPRAFYGKYKYYKNYSKDEALYFDKLENKYNFEKNEVYLCGIIKGEKNIYVFTSIFFYVFIDKSLEISSKVEYASIDKVISEQENILVYFNEEGKKKNGINELSIFCENNDIAENVVKLLNEIYK